MTASQENRNAEELFSREMSGVSWEQVEIDMAMQDVRGGTEHSRVRATFKGREILAGYLQTVAVREDMG